MSDWRSGPPDPFHEPSVTKVRRTVLESDGDLGTVQREETVPLAAAKPTDPAYQPSPRTIPSAFAPRRKSSVTSYV